MKAVIYARCSSDNQREESIDGQIMECKQYAEHNGIEIVGTYIDRAMSAKTDNRPNFQKMIKDSAKRMFDVVLVWKLDYFSLNRFDSANCKTFSKRTECALCPRRRAYRRVRTVFCLSPSSKGINIQMDIIKIV